GGAGGDGDVLVLEHLGGVGAVQGVGVPGGARDGAAAGEAERGAGAAGDEAGGRRREGGRHLAAGVGGQAERVCAARDAGRAGRGVGDGGAVAAGQRQGHRHARPHRVEAGAVAGVEVHGGGEGV